MDVTAIAVTGVSSRTGQRLLRLLDAEDSIERIVGLDVREPEFRPRVLEFHRVDVSGADVKPLLEGVDVLVHLASLFVPVPDDARMERVNIEGTRRVLDAASATGVAKVVQLSTGCAYGAWPNNPIPITEDAPLRPNRSFAFAVQMAEIERLLHEWHDEHPGVTNTILRPALVLGAGTPDAVRALVRGRMPFRVRDASPEAQYVHVDDVASALLLAVTSDLDGAYNVAPDGWLTHEDAAAVAGHVPRVAVSADVAERMLTRLWRAGLGEIPPGLVPFMSFPCVLANDRLKAAGWRPEHSSEEAIVACLEETGDLSVGGNPALRVAAAGGAIALAGALGWAVVRRLRR